MEEDKYPAWCPDCYFKFAGSVTACKRCTPNEPSMFVRKDDDEEQT